MSDLELIEKLRRRFEDNELRHPNIKWGKVQDKLEKNVDKLESLKKMELTGGEPDVVGYDEETDEYIFMDCSKESPIGRRSLCYDKAALESRKKNKPSASVIEMAIDMGIELLTEEEYRELQKLGEFDTKTSSWVKTQARLET